MGWSLLSNALRHFMIYCASQNLGITRTWICRLNFPQRPVFSGLMFFNEPEISDSEPPALSPSRRTCAHDFYVLKKSIDVSRVWTLKPWISRRERYPETTEADSKRVNNNSIFIKYLRTLGYKINTTKARIQQQTWKIDIAFNIKEKNHYKGDI